jgi:antirestriction protein
MSNDTTPRVYVGTYAKYNSGSIEGAWLNLDDYADHDDFIEACKAIHADEADPELMFQDFECFPEEFYAESSIDPEVWDWIELSEEDQLLVELLSKHQCQKVTVDEARDAFQGIYDREIDWAYDQIEIGGYLSDVDEFVSRYFDYEAYLHDAELSGDVTFIRHNGSVYAFCNN